MIGWGEEDTRYQGAEEGRGRNRWVRAREGRPRASDCARLCGDLEGAGCAKPGLAGDLEDDEGVGQG